jgi:hypothetical protein
MVCGVVCGVLVVFCADGWRLDAETDGDIGRGDEGARPLFVRMTERRTGKEKATPQ